MTVVTTKEPQPTFLYGYGAVRHIARPDHPRGFAHTEIAFCGAYVAETEREEPDDRRVCKRCSVGWVAYLDRLARGV